MKLQISFDLTDLQKAIDIAFQVAPYASILEVGALLLYKYGTESVEAFRKNFPNATILVDAKISDRAKEAVKTIAHAGADWITVMAGTTQNVIHSACTTAHELNKKIMLDLLDASALGQSALEAKGLGVDALLFHTPHDEETSLMFLDKWDIVRGNTNLPIFISGKITRDIIDRFIAIKPDGIVVGKSIIEAANPAEEAQFYQKICSSEI
jgi:3-hexulose-6-phosphate synthase